MECLPPPISVLNFESEFCKHYVYFEHQLNKLKASKLPLAQLKDFLLIFRNQLHIYFRNEEEFMNALNYPYLDQHKKQHIQLLANIDNFCRFNIKTRNYSTKDVVKHLEYWIDQHLKYEERPLFNFIDRYRQRQQKYKH